jgi:hypothetical protein
METTADFGSGADSRMVRQPARKRTSMLEAPMGGNWISGAIKHPGALHRELGVPQGEKIPAQKIAAAKHSSNPTLRKRANLADTLKSMQRGK